MTLAEFLIHYDKMKDKFVLHPFGSIRLYVWTKVPGPNGWTGVSGPKGWNGCFCPITAVYFMIHRIRYASFQFYIAGAKLGLEAATISSIQHVADGLPPANEEERNLQARMRPILTWEIPPTPMWEQQEVFPEIF